MNAISSQFAIIDSNSSTMKKGKQLPSNNLFHNHQRNLPMTSNATLPIITLSSFSNFTQKFIQMPTNNKSTIPANNIPTDVRLSHIKSSTRSFHRPNISSMPKSSFNHPTISNRSNNQQQNSRHLYVVNAPTPTLTRRIISARIRNNNNSTPVLLPPEQQQQQPNLSRPYNQYGHFLAYLRRQSLARMRRKQEEEEGNTDHVETTITLNLNKQPSAQSFQSTSNYSVTSVATDTSLVPMISMTAKRSGKLSSSYRPVQRSISSYRFNTFRQTPSPIPKSSMDDQLFSLTSSSLLVTPRNSVEDDISMPPIKNLHKLNLNDDMLKYFYINDDSGIKYQKPMISTST
jgi:hypothetical protein